MHSLLLAEPLEGLKGLAPFFIVPIAILVGAASIPSIKYLYRKTRDGSSLVLFLLGALNLWLGVWFLGIMREVNAGSDEAYEQRWWWLVYLAYLCSGVIVAAGGFAVWTVICRIYKRKNRS